MRFLILLAVLAFICFEKCELAPTTYNVGVGIADVTGPAAEINMMGYANPAQLSSGIHTRQYARAFIVEYEATRVVYVNVDCAMIDQIVKIENHPFNEPKVSDI